jgi:class 3 adenylate cyclase
VSASASPGSKPDAGQAATPLLAADATRFEVEHRLRAIVAADVVGYARHMEGDETGTVARLEHLRHGVIDALAVARGGRVTSAAGDGFILEFASAAEAIAFAVDLQARLAEQAEDARPLLMRAGVNIGDVIVRGGTSSATRSTSRPASRRRPSRAASS